MSWSLQLRNGDLFHHDGHYATCEGPVKLVQDLRLALLEHMGSDDFHPDFGSTFGGGRYPDGTEVEGVIGSLNFNQAALDIETDIRRIESDHQERQLNRMQSDSITYGRTTLRRDEILEAITAIRFAQVGTTLFCEITVKPTSGIPEIIQVPLRTL